MPRQSKLDDADNAAWAWARYRRLMWGMSLVTLAAVIASLGFLYWKNGLVSIHLYIAAAGGIAAAVMLAAALMGLVFLSSGSGHDEAIEDPFEKDHFDD